MSEQEKCIAACEHALKVQQEVPASLFAVLPFCSLLPAQAKG
jgi:hypothetical protein